MEQDAKEVEKEDHDDMRAIPGYKWRHDRRFGSEIEPVAAGADEEAYEGAAGRTSR